MRKLLACLVSLCGCHSTGQKLGIGAICFGSLVGCQTTPGMTLSWSFTLPPALNNTATLHPVAAMPATAYAVEYPTQALIQRPYLYQNTQPPAVPMPQGPPAPAPLPRPAAEPIPLPKAPCTPCTAAPGPFPQASVADAQGG